jgi:hypothetical protein
MKISIVTDPGKLFSRRSLKLDDWRRVAPSEGFFNVERFVDIQAFSNDVFSQLYKFVSSISIAMLQFDHSNYLSDSTKVLMRRLINAEENIEFDVFQTIMIEYSGETEIEAVTTLLFLLHAHCAHAYFTPTNAGTPVLSIQDGALALLSV